MRRAIIALYNEGDGKAEIARRTGVSYNTVALWIRRYEDFGTTGNLRRISHPHCTTAQQDQVPNAVL
ncbi:putative Homeodomain-like domain-containing protein 12 [Homarus americanus]|uniref:Putative Homeodomain-like domain-containing protein 12 n=1 Tax=Homarus americanus TaxID=6706 RepID=A0A8J5MWJ7_HOMAM|nr:putative Homeodomain-like domain-containing protein 12 [Homarus americanus]